MSALPVYFVLTVDKEDMLELLEDTIDSRYQALADDGLDDYEGEVDLGPDGSVLVTMRAQADSWIEPDDVASVFHDWLKANNTEPESLDMALCDWNMKVTYNDQFEEFTIEYSRDSPSVGDQRYGNGYDAGYRQANKERTAEVERQAENYQRMADTAARHANSVEELIKKEGQVKTNIIHARNEVARLKSAGQDLGELDYLLDRAERLLL